ncbi:MAG: hypothetical protein K9J13_07040 [Saprospiraceae bacterium]|nr:hypothetical protein [Saprospiraceae bacterium]
MKKSLVVISALMIFGFHSAVAQINNVAVISVWANRSVDASEFGGLSMAIEHLSKDDNFKLDHLLARVHDELFTAYAKEFPFKLIDEKTILETDGYNGIMDNVTLKFQEWQVTTYGDYLAVESRSPIRNTNAIEDALKLYKDADGVMVVILDYKLKKKQEMMGFGTAVVEAYVNIQLFNKEGKSILKIKERAESDDKFKFAMGGGVFETDEIQKLCDQSTTNLLKDMYDILPKRLAKMKKRMAK